MTFDRWKRQVDKLFRWRTCTSIIDLGIDDETLQQFYDEAHSPEEYVDWYIEHYGLDEHESNALSYVPGAHHTTFASPKTPTIPRR